MSIEKRLEKLEQQLGAVGEPMPEFVYKMIKHKVSRDEAEEAWSKHNGDARLFILKQFKLI